MINSANRNTLWASIVAEELDRAGVRTVCVSPGSRSTPLAIAFAAHQNLEVLVHIDERSSSFFGLGLAKVTKSPVALLCTSGTAAANYYPAIIEAYYSGIPLIVLTADRPPELRDCGAGQTIDQIRLYGNHVRYFFEVGTPEISGFRLRHLRSLVSRAVGISIGKAHTPSGPIHLNFPFQDPLTPVNLPDEVPDDLALTKPLAWHGRSTEAAYTQTVSGTLTLGVDSIATIANQIVSCPKGVIVVGIWAGIGAKDVELEAAIRRLATVTGYPLLAESTGLNRQDVISSYDSFFRSKRFRNKHIPDLVIRFGAMPTSKSYQIWLESHIQTQQIIIGNGSNTDPTHGLTQSIHVDPVSFCEQLANYLEIYTLPDWQDKAWRESFQQAEVITKGAIAEFLASIDTLFEGKVFAELAQWLPAYTHLFVASSMPIRDLDTFFHNQQPIHVLANRGTNGIDGVVSSALGAAWGCDRPMVLVCGDLTFYHDLNGLMAVKKYQVNLTIVLLNNDGGGIFDLLPIANFEPPFTELFSTPHGLDFAPIVQAYGCDYVQIRDWQHFHTCVLDSLQQSGTQVLEIKTDRQLNKQLHQHLWQSIQDSIDFNL